jgi:tRNA A58 N-methylase Trm61
MRISVNVCGSGRGPVMRQYIRVLGTEAEAGVGGGMYTRMLARTLSHPGEVYDGECSF